MNRIELHVTEGMDVVSEILTTAWIAEMSGINYDYVSRAIKHTCHNGKPMYFKDEHIPLLNTMLADVAKKIYAINLNGDNCFEILKVWSKRIKPVYLIEKKLGKTRRWKVMHFSDRNETRYYGIFTDKEILEFKFAFMEIAGKLSGICLVPDV